MMWQVHSGVISKPWQRVELVELVFSEWAWYDMVRVGGPPSAALPAGKTVSVNLHPCNHN